MKQPPTRLRRSPLLLREGGHHQRPGEARSAVVPERASLRSPRRSWHPLPTGQGATSVPPLHALRVARQRHGSLTW